VFVVKYIEFKMIISDLTKNAPELTIDSVCKTLNLTEYELRKFMNIDDKKNLEVALKEQDLFVYYAIFTIEYVQNWAGSREAAVKWFCSEHIPALACTARQAALNSHYEELDNYLESIALGGFA
jgi:hypothetical protein